VYSLLYDKMGLFPRAALLGCFAGTLALDNGVGLTPPMGFNPWNCFGISSKGTCKLPLPWRAQDKQPCHGFNESVMLAVARAFVDTPLQAAGYEYVNLDCGYSTGFRGADGSLTVNATRYPHGMKWLGDQFHALGLKFGMYSDAGAAQCCSRVYGAGVDDGSLGHEEADAALFASWGVDYLKHDACGEKPGSYTAMRDALNKTGRPIFYSVHGPGSANVPAVSNLWRTTGDIENEWGSIVQRALLNDGFATAGHKGGWSDPDMLEVGNLWGPLGDAEGRSQMSMWSVMKAPLLVGTDVTNMTAATLATLTHGGVLAINQDGRGEQARLLNASATPKGAVPTVPALTWVGALAGADAWTALVVNNAPTAATLRFDVGLLPRPAAMAAANAKLAARDVWARKDLPGTYGKGDVVTKSVGGHDCLLLRFEAAK